MGKRTEKRKATKNRNMLIGLAALAIAYGVSCAVVPKDTMVKGLVMNGVEVGGQTLEQAQKMLADQYEKDYKNAQITVKALEKDYKVSMYPALKYDAAKAAEEAYAFGHSNFLARGGQMIWGAMGQAKLTTLPEVKNLYSLEKQLEEAGITEINTTVQTTYELLDEELQLVKGVTGYSVDVRETDNLITAAVASDDYETVLEAPLLEGKVEDLDMDAVYEEIHKEKREATLNPKKKYKLVKSITGIDFDKEAAKKSLTDAKEGDTIHVAIQKDEPKIDTKTFKKHLFEATLGSCTTNVSGSWERLSNVKLASETINGIILMPGEEFSYNDRVGERTSARGYKKAPAYNNGQSVLELGGGVCQVSSTLYKATVLANMEITEHHNHTYESSYIGLGMDATVSWGGPDFRFKNNMDYPVKISANYGGGQLTVNIIGAKLNDHKVIFTNEILKTIGFGTKYIKDNTLEKGKTKVLSSGHNGYVVQTYRTIVDGNGKKISSVKEDYNVYSKKDQEVAQGTKKPAKKPDKKTEASTETQVQTQPAPNSNQ